MRLPASPLARIGGFLLVVAVVFGGALAVGASMGPAEAAPAPSDMAGHDPSGAGPTQSDQTGSHQTGSHQTGSDQTGSHETDAHETGHAAPDSAAVPGLAVSQDGYTLVPRAAELAAEGRVGYSFTLTGPDGHPMSSGYDVTHEKELHLIAVRRDFAGYQHVHPVRAADGTWSVDLDLTKPGSWRIYTDFAPTALGRPLTLGTDLSVSGNYVPQALPRPAGTAIVAGYQVTLAGAAVAGEHSELSFTVRRNGAPVDDLEPYLGAFGHLVSLRSGDLAYLHTHPAAEAAAGSLGGPTISFSTEFPSAGGYRLFLDFQHGGQVHTAQFTVDVTDHGH